MIIILHEIASPREELLLNLCFIQENYSFCWFTTVERLSSFNNKDKVIRSAICKSLNNLDSASSIIETYDSTTGH